MKKIIEIAKESVATYSMVGNEEMVDLQHLLAVIIGSRNAEKAMQLAKYGLRELIDLSVYELESLGLTHNEALRLHSALVLAKKLKNVHPEKRYVIHSPEDAVDYLMDEMQYLQQEHFVALFLNTQNEVMKKKTIFIGSLNASVVHPRELFKEAIRNSSASIIVAHNHPSGDPTPSIEDIHVTRRLAESGKMLGILVLDHLIIGNGRYTSLKEKGHI